MPGPLSRIVIIGHVGGGKMLQGRAIHHFLTFLGQNLHEILEGWDVLLLNMALYVCNHSSGSKENFPGLVITYWVISAE
jgi:hypothetical protein